MTAKWWLEKACAACVIMAAAVVSGPQPVNAGRASGADPVIPDCNGINNFYKDCPKDINGNACGRKYRYSNSADPGGVNTMRFEKTSVAKCRGRVEGCPPDIVDYDEGTFGCIPKKVVLE
jgi:hypothetical protein